MVKLLTKIKDTCYRKVLVVVDVFNSYLLKKIIFVNIFFQKKVNQFIILSWTKAYLNLKKT